MTRRVLSRLQAFFSQGPGGARRLAYLGIAAATAAGMAAVAGRHQAEIASLRADFVAAQQLEADRQADHVEFTLRQLYQGVRTVALLPNVRGLERSAELTDDTREAIQGVYTNTHENVALSEIYLLPPELDRRIVDPRTAGPEGPLLTFDRLIVGRSADVGDEDEEAGDEAALPEDEEEEYAVFAAQLDELAARFPDDGHYAGLELPSLWSEEIVTCDNSELSRDAFEAGDDGARRGVALTVARYDHAGRFAGAVAGIVRADVLRRMLHPGDSALVAPARGFALARDPSPTLVAAEDHLARGEPDPGLIFSYRRVLEAHDTSPWELWVVLPDSAFWSLPQVRQAQTYGWLGGAAVAALGALSFFLARSSFQRGDELRRRVAEQTREIAGRTEQLALILDNADQGFLVVDLAGRVGPECSAPIRRWFPEFEAGLPVWDLLFVSPRQRLEFRLNFEQLVEDFLPFDLMAEQIPRRTRVEDRHFELALRAVRDGERLARVLVVVSDITAKLQAELAEESARELTGVLGHLVRDRHNFTSFLEESSTLLADCAVSSDLVEFKRHLHTLKGNTALYGFKAFSQRCHELEQFAIDVGALPPAARVEELLAAWRADTRQLGEFMRGGDRVSIAGEELAALEQRIKLGAPHADLLQAISALRLEPIANRLRLLGDRAAGIAQRLGKSLDVEVEDGGVRLPHDALTRLFAALAHVVRNAVDHGVEAPERRAAAGKPEAGRLALGARIEGEELLLSIEDDGSGVDWDAVRQKAAALGLPSATEDDLTRALFSDGLSTREAVTELSGRGVGMSAVLEACRQVGGRVAVATAPGRGTRVELRIPGQAVVGARDLRRAA